jgi:Adenylate and Guanylate cyclase catalytic domain
VETLTFLFTDIEGSTALLGRLGDDDYAQLLAGHHALVRSALAGHGGREVDTQGDAFFAVFSSPRACVAAAAGFPSNRGDFPIADSCNFAASSDYRTPVHFVPWRSSVCPGRGIRTRRALGGAGWGLPVLPA